MSNLSNQQINSSFNGLLQVPGGITSSLQTVQDGNGNPTGLSISSTQVSGINNSSFRASLNGTPYSNSVNRLISDGFGDYLSVKDFGAVGNGSTDDTVAIQNAINSASSSGANIFFPPGSYVVSPAAVGNGGLYVNINNCSFYGVPGASIIIASSATFSGKALIQYAGCSNFVIFGITFDMNNALSGSGMNSCMFVDQCDNFTIDNCNFKRINQFGIAMTGAINYKITNNYFYKDAKSTTQNQAINGSDSGRTPVNGLIQNNYLQNSAIYCDGNKTQFINNTISGFGFGSGITVGAGAYNYISGNNIQGGGTVPDSNSWIPAGMEMSAVNSVAVGNNIYGNGGNGIDWFGEYGLIEGNIIVNNGVGAIGASGIVARGDGATSTYRANHLNVIGNTIANTSGTQAYCFREYDPSNNLTDITFNFNKCSAATAIFHNVNYERIVVNNYNVATTTWIPGSIAAGANITTNVYAPGSRVQGPVIASADISSAGLILTAYSNVSNNVVLTLQNISGSSINPGTLNVTVYSSDKIDLST